MKPQTRQLAQDTIKSRIIDVAQGAGGLQTPMTQLLGTLDTYGCAPADGRRARAVRHARAVAHPRLRRALLVPGVLRDRSAYAAYAARTLPNTEVIVADSIEAVKTGALRGDKYDLILSDNPSRSPFGKGYVEHFDLFPDLLRYIDDGVLVLSVLPPGTELAPEHARRRQEFYGKVDPSVDEAAAVYLEHLAAAGLHTPRYHYTYRNAGLGYLAFVCRN
ncbi:MAG: hypothetical protein ACXVFT_12540 [Solirubrobacteraceae bacterium]